MRVKLTEAKIKKLPKVDADVYDSEVPKLVLRTRESGQHSWRVAVGRGKWITLGALGDHPLDTARELAQATLGDHAHGVDVVAEARRKKVATFNEFIEKVYTPWATQHLKTAPGDLARLTAQFGPLFGEKPLTEIDAFAVERWRTRRLKAGVSKGTVNRDLAAFRSCLSHAVQWGALHDHPLRRVRQLREDTKGTIRYLTPIEEVRLRLALVARENRRRAERESANAFRTDRKYPLLPEYGTYTDHLTPFVLVALNTGCRRGELFNLKWRDLDLTRKILTVRGEGAKSGRTRHIPLNDEAVTVLKAWKPEQPEADTYVFPGEAEGKPLVTIKTAWLALVGEDGANLKDFRLHDLRHTFASHLAQRGVDLATVRELLGHSDFKLTLRYSHLAPENLSAAVAKLNAR